MAHTNLIVSAIELRPLGAHLTTGTAAAATGKLSAWRTARQSGVRADKRAPASSQWTHKRRPLPLRSLIASSYPLSRHSAPRRLAPGWLPVVVAVVRRRQKSDRSSRAPMTWTPPPPPPPLDQQHTMRMNRSNCALSQVRELDFELRPENYPQRNGSTWRSFVDDLHRCVAPL